MPYKRVIRKCDMELQRINGLERGANMSDHAKIIKELWMNRSRGDNEETLEIMIKAKHKMRETLDQIMSMDGG